MQSIFPATYSTLCPKALSSLISEKYGIAPLACKLLVRNVGDTYLAETGSDRFIVRVYRSSHRTLPQIESEAALLVALKNAGVSVSYPVADLSGNRIQRLQAAEGERHAVVFTFAKGRAISKFTDTQLRNLGHEVARFHNISAEIELEDKRWTFNLETTLFQPLEMVKEYFDYDPGDYLWWKQAAAQVQKKLAQLNTSTFSSGYCHFDFLPKNFHFDGDEVTLFDFDFLGYGWLVNDVMTFWTHLAIDAHFGRLTKEDADNYYKTFLQAYTEYRTLTDEELEAVPYLCLGFWLFYAGFHTTHDQFYLYLQPEQLKARTAFVRQLTQKYWSGEFIVR